MLQKIGILYHPMVEATHAKAKEIREFLRARGAESWLCSAWEPAEIKAQLKNTELVLTVGGDGTILRAAQAIYAHKIPITGINMGKLGFMTELDAGEALEKLPELLAGEGWFEERAMLDVRLEAPGKPRTFTLLNDVVMARGAIARVVRIDVRVDGAPFKSYRADGVIVATATGSTGYALAAGGPILHPRSKDFILTPIAAHLSPSYPLVLPAKTVVNLKINCVHEATLSIDGHLNLPLPDGASITVSQSRHKVRFFRISPEGSFYLNLEQKLKGKR